MLWLSSLWPTLQPAVHHLFWISHPYSTQFLACSLVPSPSILHIISGNVMDFQAAQFWRLIWCLRSKNLSEAIHLILCFLWPHSAAQVHVWCSWQRFGVSGLPDKYNGRRDGQGIWAQENGFKWCVVEFKLGKEGSKGIRRQSTGKHGRMKGLDILKGEATIRVLK